MGCFYMCSRKLQNEPGHFGVPWNHTIHDVTLHENCIKMCFFCWVFWLWLDNTEYKPHIEYLTPCMSNVRTRSSKNKQRQNYWLVWLMEYNKMLVCVRFACVLEVVIEVEPSGGISSRHHVYPRRLKVLNHIVPNRTIHHTKISQNCKTHSIKMTSFQQKKAAQTK